MMNALDKALEYVQDRVIKLLKIHQGSVESHANLDEWNNVDHKLRAWEEDRQKEGIEGFLKDMVAAFTVIRNKISNVVNWKRVKPKMAKEGYRKKKEAELSWYDKEFLKKLKEKSAIDTDTRCWIWQGKINEDSGEPAEKYRGIFQGAALVAHQIHTGNIKVGYLWKICGNKTCVNPEHVRTSKTLVDYLAHTPGSDISDYRYMQLGMEVVREYRKKHNISIK